MRKFILLQFFSLVIFGASAQKAKYYTLQPGDNVLEIIPRSELYQYPQFEQGIVNFKNGKRSSAKLNYHYVYEEILFAGTGGDTLTLSNPDEVRSVTIGKDEFYFWKNRYVKLDTTIGTTKLATTGFFATISKKRIGAYGTTTDGGTDSYSSFIVPNTTKLDLVANVVTTVAKSNALFIGNKYNQFFVVTKKDIFSFFPEKEAQLKQYLKDNKVDFASREDIIGLIIHMEKL